MNFTLEEIESARNSIKRIEDAFEKVKEFHIDFNDHRSSYQTILQFISDVSEVMSDVEKSLCIMKETVVQVSAFGQDPNDLSFCVASSLAAALDGFGLEVGNTDAIDHVVNNASHIFHIDKISVNEDRYSLSDIEFIDNNDFPIAKAQGFYWMISDYPRSPVSFNGISSCSLLNSFNHYLRIRLRSI